MSAESTDQVTPIVQWNLDVEAGDPAEIFSVQYIFERVDADNVVTFRAPAGSAAQSDFMIIGKDGHPRKPYVYEVYQLERDHLLIWRDKPLSNDARRYARAQGLDTKQAREWDRLAQFRMAIVRRYDRAPWSKSDFGLTLFMAEALKDPTIASLPGAWPASPASIRTWLLERGTEGCRKEVDGVSMRNRMRHTKKVAHPLEIIFYWAARATNVRGSVQQNHDRYVADIAKINAGEPLNRNFLADPDGAAGPCERPALYPIPARGYKAVNYNSFWRLCRTLKSARAHSSKTSAQGTYQRYGGGGLSDQPTTLGALCWIDSTPVKKAFFVDDATGIPIGAATLTLLIEHLARAVLGWDLTAGACSSTAVLRTVLSANSIKEVPEDLLKIDSNLPYMRLRPDEVGFDNATEQHGRSVEDVFADAFIGTRWAGADMPRDKNVIERVLGTFQELLYNHVEDASYDIALMRRYGFSPEEKGHVLCSLSSGRRLLARAALSYNLKRHRGHDNQQPALVWKKLLRRAKLKVLKDVDKFKRSIGTINTVVMTSAGFEKFNRRYTPGAVAMKRIIQQFERAAKLPVGDTSPKPKAARDERKRPGFKVKIKINEDDIGSIQVWNPHAGNGQWEDFGCTNPDAYGMPLWLHRRCLEIAERDAMDYLSPEGQSVVLARLYEETANVDSHAAERERRTLARAYDDPTLREVLARYVEVVDEVVEQFGEPEPEEHTPAPQQMAVGIRKDADIPTPRSAPQSAKAPVRLRRRSTAHADRPKRSPAAPPARRTSRTDKNDGYRIPTAPSQSANRPDQQAQTRAGSTRLKWGDTI